MIFLSKSWRIILLKKKDLVFRLSRYGFLIIRFTHPHYKCGTCELNNEIPTVLS